MSHNMKDKKILFYIERNLHLPFLEPVHDYFKEHYPDVDVVFSTPPYKPAMNGQTGYGLDEPTLRRLSGKSRIISDISRYMPHITVVADIGAAYGLKDCGSIVNVGHGLTSKGCFYTHRPIVRRENLADLVCVPGPLHKKILEKNVFVPITCTGFITSDKIFDNPENSRSKFCQQHNIDQNKKIILFAPTFNEELSAIPVVKDKIFKIASSENHLIIKLHGMTDKKWVDLYKNKADLNLNATFISDQPLTPCLMAADLLISDVSSSYVEFLLLDRPIILIDNPHKSKFILYDPEDIEYRLSDACTVVDNFQELEKEIFRNLSNPEKLSRKRKNHAKAICYGQDGKAAQRVAHAIHEHFYTYFNTNFTILIFWDHLPTRLELLRFWEKLKESTRKYKIEVIMIGPKPIGCNLNALCKKWIECSAWDSEVLEEAITSSKNEYIAFIRPDINLIHGWLKYFFCHFQWNPHAGLVQAITPDNGYEVVLSKFFPECKKISFSKVSFLFNRYLIGLSVNSPAIDSTCFMLKKSVYTQTDTINRNQDYPDLIMCLEHKVKNKKILKCIDTFAYISPVI